MAEIVLGIGSAHGPLLSTPPEQWDQRVVADRRNEALWFRGRAYDFPSLVAARKDDRFEKQITLDVWRRRHAACGEAGAESNEAT